MIKNFTTSVILLLLVVPLFAQVNLQDQLLLHYDFSGNTNDISGNAVNGTANGNPTLTTDRFDEADKAFSFDGVDDYISAPPSTIMPEEYSYSLWALPTANDGVVSLLSIGDATINQSVLLSFTDGWVGGSFLDNGVSYTAISTDLPELNKWFHIVILRAKNYVKLYVNGVLVNEDNTIPNLSATYGSSPVAYVGRRSNQSQYFKGKIDEVRIYSRIINESEIAELFDFKGTATSKPITSTGFTVSPNPSSGKFKVELAEVGDYEVKVSSALGEIIYDDHFQNLSSFNLMPIDKNGVYFLHIKSSKGVSSTERIVVANQ